MNFGRTLVHLPSGEEAARLDREAMREAGVSGPLLMENAGRSAAILLRRVYPETPVVVVAGSGNNGGDGVVLARTLVSWGLPVRLYTLGRSEDPDPLLHGWPVPTAPFPEDAKEADLALAGAGVVVDALLGTGISGAPRAPHAHAIEAINRVSAPVVALDLPSGVSGENGAAPGPAVQAELTIAFGAPKVGSLRFPGRALSGRLTAIEIGFPPWKPEQAGARVITPGWFSEARPRRQPVTHKNAEGRVLLLAGSPGMAGAAVLAARGALRAGAGFVRIASVPENREILQHAVPEATFVDASDSEAMERALAGSDVVAAGPGMGTDPASGDRLRRVFEHGARHPLVLDADALTLLSENTLPDPAAGRGANSVLLTPHPGEFARLLGRPPGADPIDEAREEAKRRGCALLLKGSPSVVAGGSGPVWVSATGSSDLARAGMGDVLTGVAGAFLARGVGAAEAGALALHATGWAALAAGKGEALLPGDIAEGLGMAFRAPGDGVTDIDLPFLLLDLDPPR